MAAIDDTYELAVLTQHPIQYHAPLYRRYDESPRINVTVFYCCNRGVEAYADQGLGGAEVKWDRPLLEGYDSEFLPNWSPLEPVDDGFFSLFNPAIIQRLAERSFDAISIHGHNFFSYHLGFAVARSIGLPIFYSCDTHLMLDRTAWKAAVRHPLVTAFFRNFQAFLSIGTKNREYYRAHGVPDEKIFHVPYTVDNEFFRQRSLGESEKTEFLKREGLDPTLPTILYVSKLTARKRPFDLIEAYADLRSRGVTSQLALIGDGPLQEQVAERATATPFSDDIHLLGFRNQSELPAWYSAADVFVLPSENEPWAVVVNEAMNGATPVVATTDVGAAHDLIESGETGFVYEPGDISALAQRLETILADPNGCHEMGKAALERVDQWSYDEAVAGMERALNSVR